MPIVTLLRDTLLISDLPDTDAVSPPSDPPQSQKLTMRSIEEQEADTHTSILHFRNSTVPVSLRPLCSLRLHPGTFLRSSINCDNYYHDFTYDFSTYVFIQRYCLYFIM